MLDGGNAANDGLADAAFVERRDQRFKGLAERRSAGWQGFVGIARRWKIEQRGANSRSSIFYLLFSPWQPWRKF
jgi:hypothetical protein